MAILALLCLPLGSTGCEQSGQGPGSERSNTRSAANYLDQRRILRDSELTPAIRERAQRILREHAGEAIGYEVPFSVEGKRYVGRLERHYHEPGSEEGPQGEHTGVTVYEVAR